MIELQNVSKSFTGLQAVDNVSFQTRPGEIFGLIGPNGAGKSTTIRMIMNILVPDSGEILFDGRPIREKDKERIGYLPEERGLYKKVKVNEVLRYLGSLKTDHREALQRNIDSWLDKFGLTEWKDKPVETLSKGMSQKVQFIAAVAHDPEIIFFDEPFSGLDPVSSDLLKDSILDLGRQGKTILFSTHIMDHAEKICGQIFLINRGKELLSGPLEEIKARHGRNVVTLEFSGDGSFIRDLPGVEQTIDYPRYCEVQLEEGHSPDRLLKDICGRISLRKFEVEAPSLHKIFIGMVKESENQAKGGSHDQTL
jgi:ABC-2 type transport system ATP-binding protein